MRKTKNNLIKAALFAEDVKFTINGVYELKMNDNDKRKLKVFEMRSNGGCVTDGQLFGRQMNVDKDRSNGRFLTLYSYDLMSNRTTSKIQYSRITILN